MTDNANAVDEAILFERRGDVALIRFNRPEASNAVDPATMARFCDALDRAIDDRTIRAIVIGHTGKHFVAGADFGFLDALTRASVVDIRRDIYEHFQGAARRLHLCDKPTVAAVGGAAITVGCELAIACDFRVITEKAVFQESWIKLGLIPPLGGLKLLPSLVGFGVAKDMILRCRALRGAEAVSLGLASELVAAEELERRAVALASELAALPPLAYAAAKSGLRKGLESSFEEGWELNLLAQSILLGSDDFRASVASVAQTRNTR